MPCIYIQPLLFWNSEIKYFKANCLGGDKYMDESLLQAAENLRLDKVHLAAGKHP